MHLKRRGRNSCLKPKKMQTHAEGNDEAHSEFISDFDKKKKKKIEILKKIQTEVKLGLKNNQLPNQKSQSKP